METIPERRGPFRNELASLAVFHLPISITRVETNSSMLPAFFGGFFLPGLVAVLAGG